MYFARGILKSDLLIYILHSLTATPPIAPVVVDIVTTPAPESLSVHVPAIP